MMAFGFLGCGGFGWSRYEPGKVLDRSDARRVL
jgi:hypothetical protein